MSQPAISSSRAQPRWSFGRKAKDHQDINRVKEDLAAFLLLVLSLVLILVLEYSTLASFVFGYLYTGPIILTFWQFSRRAGYGVTTLACIAVLLNLWIPWTGVLEHTTVVNRCIAALALVVTGYLSDRNRRYEEGLHASQTQLSVQKQLVKVREDFVATLTHDLRTPILGAVETLGHLREDLEHISLDALERALDVLERSCRGQLQLIETLLQIYRTDNTGLTLNPEPFDLVPLIAETLATLEDLANRRAIRLSYTGLAEAWACADAVQLQRVLNNLIINGLNHTPRGGCVAVTLSDAPATEQWSPQLPPQSRPAHYLLAVSDTGRGIPADDLEHLFKRFYQGQRKRQTVGTGLGLYLARQIIETHGGQICVENRPTGGVTFTVELPHDSRCPALTR